MRIWLGLMALLAACGTDKDAAKGSEVLRFDAPAPPGAIGDAYTYNLSARGGLQPYRYKLDGILPKGLTFSGNRISGVPTEKGSFKLRITVEDANLSTKFSEPTLTIGDPTPPELLTQLPEAETDQSFIFAARIKGRETGAMRATFQIGGLKPELESFEVPLGFISISRYDPKTGTLDFDGVFVEARKDLEVFRLNLRPEQALKPKTIVRQTQAFYDKALKPFPQTGEVKREKSEGKYGFADLQAIAKNWKKAVKLEPAKEEKAAAPSEDKAAPPSEEKPTDPATEKAEEASKQEANAEAEPETPKEEVSEEAKTEEAKETAGEEAKTEEAKEAETATDPAKAEEAKPKEEAKSAEGQETKQTEEKPADPAKSEVKEGEASKEGEAAKPTEPTKPADSKAQGSAQPAKPEPDKLEGDLNDDSVVNEKDLEVLRGSYRWESVVAETQNPADPAKPAGPGGTPPKAPAGPGK
jgi:hypothetical protein